MIDEFKKFIMRGNVIDLAVGIVIGVAFTTIVNSLVADVIMPPIGYALGGVDFSDIVITLREAAGDDPAVTINIGVFINTIINFLIVGLAMFLVIKAFNQLQRQPPPPEPTTKECPFCLSVIPIKATRCAHCTSKLAATSEEPSSS
jgi:large conductance mechanosensitive channel